MTGGSLLQTARSRGAQPLRFVLAGAVNTAFGLSIYPAIRLAVPYLRAHYQLALFVAQATSLCFAYLMYKWMVFRAHTSTRVAREMGTFSTFYILAAAVNWAALPLMVEHLGLGPNIAQTGFSLLLMASSYFWHSRLTFRPARDRGQ